MSTPLESFPRVRLAHLPTPLEPLPRLSAALTDGRGRPEIWVKRDDCTGLATGGNKARKLEYLLGAALLEGVDTVITIGGVQSNHARQTAAAAARLGLRCQLVLPRVVARTGLEYEHNGNLLLDRIFGAEVFVVADESEAARCIHELSQAAERDGRRVVVHPPGGSTPVGALGYVAAARELEQQIARGAPAFAATYLAVGSGGTVAGLAAGGAARLIGVCVAGREQTQRREVEGLLVGLAKILDAPAVTCDSIRFEPGFLGAGYGLPSPATLEAIVLCARTEGLLLDPVYTGKAMAALIADVRAGRAGEDPILFWHTGGSSGLFAYREEISRVLG